MISNIEFGFLKSGFLKNWGKIGHRFHGLYGLLSEKRGSGGWFVTIRRDRQRRNERKRLKNVEKVG